MAEEDEPFAYDRVAQAIQELIGSGTLRPGERVQAGLRVAAARRRGQVGDRSAEQRGTGPCGRGAVALEEAADRQAADQSTEPR